MGPLAMGSEGHDGDVGADCALQGGDLVIELIGVGRVIPEHDGCIGSLTLELELQRLLVRRCDVNGVGPKSGAGVVRHMNMLPHQVRGPKARLRKKCLGQGGGMW